MLYFLFQIIALSFPGWLLCQLFRIKNNLFLFSISLSYVFFISIAVAAKLLHWSTGYFYTSYLALLLLLLAAYFPRFVHRSRSFSGTGTNHYLIGACLVATLYTLYRFWAGPYMEIPADVYRHLEYSQEQLRWIEQGYLGGELTLKQLFNQGGQLWYTFYALVTHLSGQNIVDTFSQAMLANGLLFLLAVYSFGHFLFQKFQFTPFQRTSAALFSTLFVSLHMGINVFSYLRYYSLAPTMLNFILFFSGIVCILALFENKCSSLKWVAVLISCTLAAAVVHTQEALYITVLGTLMLAWGTIHTLGPKLNSYPASYWLRITLQDRKFLLFLALAATAMLIEIWSYTYLERAPLLQGKVITVSATNSFLNRLPILNPEYQFVRVLTVWGLLIYILFFFNFRRLSAQPYFVAGMFIPIFTVFNPVFVDLFLRLDNSTTLWRLCYAIPIHFVGGWAAVHYSNRLAASSGITPKLESFATLSLLFLLLLPLNFGSWKNAYARTTISPVSEGNDYRHWNDMVQYLNTLPQRETILTDPVTGYVISALTHHRTFHNKFFPNQQYKKHWDELNSSEIDLQGSLQNWLLVINLRESDVSLTENRARHWPSDILFVSQHYPETLQQRISKDPNRFHLLWSQDKITLYRITLPLAPKNHPKRDF